MAENLPFSIANILRSDFPDPSRINKLPSMAQNAALRESREALFTTRNRLFMYERLHHRCNETRAFGESYFTAELKNPEEVPQNFFGIEEERQNRFIKELKEKDNKRKTTQNIMIPKESKALRQKFPKKKRTHFSRMQVKYLEDIFSCQQYLTRDERALLANGLGMKELQIRNWFQNRRYQLRHRGEPGQTGSC